MFYLSLLMAIRFFGLFIVMPLLAIYALSLQGANPFYVGIALGGYALSQLFLQIPFGKLADKYDKKKILIVGLLLLTIGSLICAYATNIYMLIVGRLIQGAGAIGGVVLAYMSELSKEDKRAKTFAKMGQLIAISFGLSMILGPIIGANYGVDKLFLLTAFLSLVAIILVIFKVPNPPKITHHQKNASLKEILKNKELLKLFFSGFLQKGFMTLFFMLIPIIFTKQLNFEKTELWKIYIPGLIVGIFAMPFGAILAEKKQKVKLVFILSAFFITLSLFLFFIGNKYSYFLGVLTFFFGFNMLEPVLQSFVSKIAKVNQKATALSTSNAIQYLGIFIGGAIAGYFVHHNMLKELLLLLTFIGIVWIFILAKMKLINKIKIVEYKEYDKSFIEALKSEKNVYDFYERNGVLVVRYLK